VKPCVTMQALYFAIRSSLDSKTSCAPYQVMLSDMERLFTCTCTCTQKCAILPHTQPPIRWHWGAPWLGGRCTGHCCVSAHTLHTLGKCWKGNLGYFEALVNMSSIPVLLLFNDAPCFSCVSCVCTSSLISSASSMERGEVFCGPTDWLGSCDPMTHL
jgi:hypothetical protein